MKKRLALVTVAMLTVTIAVAAYNRATATAEPPAYTTAAVTRTDIVETVEATGTLGAVTTVQVGSQVSGTIQSLHADFNSIVKKGQVVARLDPSLMQAQVEQAQATVLRLEAEVERSRVAVDDAQVKLRRARELFTNGLVARADVETAGSTARQAEASLAAAGAQVTQARAALDQNRVNLSHTVITAPVDGIVISRSVDVGQTVAASMSAPTLFVIAKDLTAMQVEASVDEADIGRIAAGQPVTFRVDAYTQQVFTGTVAQVRLDAEVVQNVVSYTTVIDVPNPERKLRPGMTANVTIEIARAHDVLAVPNAALRFQPPVEGRAGSAPTGGRVAGSGEAVELPGRRAAERPSRVWTLQDDRLRPVRVGTGISNGTLTAVLEGELAENAPVVTGVTTANQGAAQTTASPLIPQRPGASRQGARGAAAQGATR